MVCIGVLALQGAFAEHVAQIQACGATAVEIRKVEHLQGIHGLIIPGGESTVMSKLMEEEGLMPAIKHLGHMGLPIFGTCAGLIMLCTHIAEHEHQATLGLLDATVRRNAFGRQVESFCTELLCTKPLSAQENATSPERIPVPAVFIRAPLIERIGDTITVLARVEEKIVAVQQDNILACSFHPELTTDTTWHSWLVERAQSYALTTH